MYLIPRTIWSIWSYISDSLGNRKIMNCISYSLILNYLIWIIKIWMGSVSTRKHEIWIEKNTNVHYFILIVIIMYNNLNIYNLWKVYKSCSKGYICNTFLNFDFTILYLVHKLNYNVTFHLPPKVASWWFKGDKYLKLEKATYFK